MISQGTIFNSGQAFDYEDCEVYGIVISARCDVYNSKSSVYHYLPVVKFEDWFYKDFKNIFLTVSVNEKTKDLESYIKPIGLDKHDVLSYGYLEFANNFELKFEKKHIQKIQKICEYLDKAKKCNSNEDFNNLLSLTTENQIAKKLEELLSDNDNYKGFFFLNDAICHLGNCVVLLKEIKEISPKVIDLLDKYNKFDYKGFLLLGNKEEDLKNLKFSEQENSEIKIMCTIESPIIESILQRFSLIFSRVGIDRKIVGNNYYMDLFHSIMKE